jgi:hypothetical protein
LALDDAVMILDEQTKTPAGGEPPPAWPPSPPSAMERPVFLASSARRRRGLRLAARGCAVLTAAWLACMVAGSVGFMHLPGMRGSGLALRGGTLATLGGTAQLASRRAEAREAARDREDLRRGRCVPARARFAGLGHTRRATQARHLSAAIASNRRLRGAARVCDSESV